MRRALFAALLVASIGVAGVARAQTRADLEKARAAYLARNYAEAEERLRALVDPKTGFKERALLSQARMNLAAVLLAQGKKDAAGDMMEKLILEDPAFEPDPLGFPGDVINTFIDVRASLQDRIKLAAQEAARREEERKRREEAERRARAKYQHDLEVQASTERVTVKNQRLVAFVPFGAGQFQNRQAWLGWIFLGTESALTIATAVTVPMYAYARGRAVDESQSGDVDAKAQQYADRAESIRVVNLGLVGALVGVMVVGIAQANIAFVDEVSETKKRDLPKLEVSKIAPVVSPVLGREGNGVFVGLSGATF